MTRSEILQTAKPILFNTEMVQAILDGRKAVTRRVIKPQPKMKLCYAFAGYGHGKWHYPDKNAWKYWGKEFERPDTMVPEDEEKSWTPPCHTDDILYVRETWSEWTGGYLYRAWPEWSAQPGAFPGEKWRPSIHMPKEAARIFLQVTDVRVERLQDISEEDVVAEGAEPLIQCPREHAIIDPDGTTGDMCWNTGYCKQCDYINKSYGELFGEIVWDNVIKKSDLSRYGWAANPWCWVIEFERVEL